MGPVEGTDQGAHSRTKEFDRMKSERLRGEQHLVVQGGARERPHVMDLEVQPVTPSTLLATDPSHRQGALRAFDLEGAPKPRSQPAIIERAVLVERSAEVVVRHEERHLQSLALRTKRDLGHSGVMSVASSRLRHGGEARGRHPCDEGSHPRAESHSRTSSKEGVPLFRVEAFGAPFSDEVSSSSSLAASRAFFMGLVSSFSLKSSKRDFST